MLDFRWATVIFLFAMLLAFSAGGCNGDSAATGGDSDNPTTDGDGDDDIVIDGDGGDGDLTDGDITDGDATDGDTGPCERRCISVDGSLDFGGISPGNCNELFVNITNVGSETLTIIDVHLTSDTSTEFSISEILPQEPTVELQPTHPLKVTVQYCPVDIEEDSGTLIVGSNAQNGARQEVPITMSYKGSVTMEVAPLEIEFGDQDIGSLNRQFFSISAVPDQPDTTRPLEVSSITFSMADDINFSLPLADTDCDDVFFVEAGEEHTCGVDFKPSTFGDMNNTINIVGNDYLKDQQLGQVAVYGTGVAPQITVIPPEVDFGHVLINLNGVSKTIVIENPGSATLQILSTSWIGNQNNDFSIMPNIAGRNIDPRGSLQFIIKFDPKGERLAIGTLDIISNADTEVPVQVAVSGVGVTECPPGMQVDPESENQAQCIVACNPGEYICLFEEEGWGYRECQQDGETLGDFVACPLGDVCTEGSCHPVPCNPGQVRCYVDPDSEIHYQQRCEDNGTGWQDAEECITTNVCEPVRCINPGALCQIQYAPPTTECNDNDACTEFDFCDGNGICRGREKICDDENDCTDDLCYPGEGCRFTPNNNNTCNDNNGCTSNDHCDNGECVGSSAIDCDDSNDCTYDSCDPDANPPCSHTPVGGNCDDGEICTLDDYCCPLDGSEVCLPGVCVPGPRNTCDDGNDCTDDVCAEGTGCRHNQRSGSCEDGNPCTEGDICGYVGFDYICISGTETDCNDGNPCTEDSCDAQGACIYEYIEGPAEGCTTGSACTAKHCCTTEDAGGGLCDLGECYEGEEQSCDDLNECTADYCHPTLGCQHLNTSDPCDDGNPCTVGDACSGGRCWSGATKNCDDGNDCTTNMCNSNAAEGEECEATPVTDGGACSDDDLCTTGDRCVGGVCEPTGGTSCADTNPCTIDGCDADGCTHEPDFMAPCDDGNPCTLNDTCNAAGQCAAGTTQLTCPEDDDPVSDKDVACRNYYCLNYQGCKWTAKTGACDDGDPCTIGDYCNAGSCISGTTQDTCNDGKDCTSDVCIPGQGCENTPITGSCDDGDPCTVGDSCDAGECVSGTDPLDCDDGNECTEDSCQAGVGCKYSTRNGQPCTHPDQCYSGHYCSGSTCIRGPNLVDCSDGEPCTDDSCDPDLGCINTPDNSNSCTDGNECTIDVCNNGLCNSDQARDCNDYDVCTDDDCNPATGCFYVNNTDPCDDDKFCTHNDTCNAGSCNGTPYYCDDQLTETQCQIASCNETYNRCDIDNSSKNGNSCDDGLYCKVNSTCSNGVCTNGANKDCSAWDADCKVGLCDEDGNTCYASNKGDGTSCPDDGKVCTTDTCQGGICDHTNRTGSCDDGNPCTENTTCSGDQCLGTPVADGTWCDDNDGNTLDSSCSSGTCVGSDVFVTTGSCGPWGRSDMVKVVGTPYCVDKYEARVCFTDSCSSPTNCANEDVYTCWQNDGNTGVGSFCDWKPARACQIAGATPTYNLTFDQAKKACENVGKSLCPEIIWPYACSEGNDETYPYGNSYDPNACNGSDYSGSGVRNTGSTTGCINSLGAYDMSGNLWEWADNKNYSQPDQPKFGGGFQSSSGNLTCTSSSDINWETKDSDLGFRCCDLMGN